MAKAPKTIFVVGIALPDIEGLKLLRVGSDQSLLDADIVVFRPTLSEFETSNTESYQGRTLFTKSQSFSIREKIDHWKTQLVAAHEAGKTILIYLPSKEEYFYHTGEQTHSGTGRSRVTTNIINSVNNHALLPFRFDSLVPGQGRAMKLDSSAGILARYWAKAEEVSRYEAHFAISRCRPLVITKSGEKVVGAQLLANGKGSILILPDLDFDQEDFTNPEGTHWTPTAEQFAYWFRDAVLEIDALLRADAEGTPAPDWVGANEFRFDIEAEIEAEILRIGSAIENLSQEREEKRRELRTNASLRALLYEKGKPLEAAVREALQHLGFQVASFKAGNSEFDALFESQEGRFLGEVEGKDNKSISVDKYSQLERNINEDFSRDDVTSMAKGVLFGNAYRLLPLDSRLDYFTEKVQEAAKRTGTVLVRTPDLFVIAKYLKQTPDPDFAKQCRQAIVVAAGRVVQFPPLPALGAEAIGEVES